MTAVLIVTRKGDVQQVFVSENTFKLADKAAELDGSALSWQGFYGGVSGAHSNHDEERSYAIHPAHEL